MNWTVPLSDLDYGLDEEQAVLTVLRSKWLTMGAVTQQFEQEFAQAHGAPFALAVSNATQALHLACLAIDIGPGDEVIVPSLSFVATSNAVLYTGARVRFADICGPTELTIDPAEIERCLTPRTKAVIVMHYAGFPCRMPAILEIARRHHLAVIEDAAHAPGAFLDGKALGTWGDIGCYSFFSNKNLSTGEGGMLVTHREDLAARLKNLRSHGMTSLTWDRHHGHAYTYDVVDLGYNDRIDEIRSALGRVQLAKLPANNARRARIACQYWSAFSAAPLTLPFKDQYFSSAESQITNHQSPSFHIFPILLPPGTDRQSFADRLREVGVQTSLHYPPIHTFTYYREHYPGISLPITEAAAAREVTLPLYPTLRPGQIERVIAATLHALEI